ncbi:MAG: ATP-dependent DNA ligase [Candidatus Nanoarchaeia archaeon]|nr:ATP-dependent DNA ligase [Candidatus Nanoarchaeia archaeon]
MDYSELAGAYDELEKTSKRLEKTAIIAKILKDASKDEIADVICLLQGSVFTAAEKDKHIGISSKLAAKAVANCAGVSQEKVEEQLGKEGDLGIVAEKLFAKKKQSTLFLQKLSVKKVVATIRKLSEIEGRGSVDMKVGFVSQLLNSASGIEARYIARTVLENLRTGVGDSTIRDAVVLAFSGFSPDNKEKYSEAINAVQSAYDLSNDLGKVAITLKEKGIEGLKAIEISPGNPLKVMLYVKAQDFADAFEIVGKPALAERKFDGFRMQIHGENGNIKLYTRRLDDVTRQFPDVVELVKNAVKAKSFIIDSEVVGIDPKTKKFRPFQDISQRIQRKYGIQEMIKELPVIVEIFDAMELHGRSLLNLSFEERRKSLKGIVKEIPGRIVLVEQKLVKSESELEKFYNSVLREGVEGVMLKNISGIYKPGSRVGFGVKIKPTMETLDLVITRAEWGEGKRAQWLSSFTLACRDDEGFLEIGKVGTGVKEKTGGEVSFEQLTELLKPLIISQKGKQAVVKPKIVVEVLYQEIQKSPSYTSGYALRFPRVVRMRDEKGADDANSLSDVERLYYHQLSRKHSKKP